MPKTKIKSIILFTAMVLVVSGCGRELGIKNEELGIKDSGEMGGLVEQVATTEEDLGVASLNGEVVASSSELTDELNDLNNDGGRCKDEGLKDKCCSSNDFLDKKYEKLDTSGWLTYENNEYGFRVKYPKYLNITSDNAFYGYANPSKLFRIMFHRREKYYDGAAVGVIVSSAKEGSISNREIVENSFFINLQEGNPYIDTKKVLVNDYDMEKIALCNNDGLTFLRNGAYVFGITYEPSGEIDKSVYEAFLSSFEIIK